MTTKTINKNNISRCKIILAISLALLVVNYIFNASINATFGYHFLSVVVLIFSYSVILAIISALIALLLRRFKTLTFILFSWLFLFAVIFNIGVTVFKVITTYRINNIINPKNFSSEELNLYLDSCSDEELDEFIDNIDINDIDISDVDLDDL